MEKEDGPDEPEAGVRGVGAPWKKHNPHVQKSLLGWPRDSSDETIRVKLRLWPKPWGLQM